VDPERVCVDPPFAEGPVWCPDDGPAGGTLVCTSVSAGALYRVDPTTATCAQLADVGGGANGAAPAADGGFVVTQNGGLDFDAVGLFEDPPPTRAAPPGLQRVAPDGTVTYLAAAGLQSPNDLVVDGDGTVWFTDPPPWPLPDAALGRVWGYRPDGTLTRLAEGLWYPNGIAREPDGTLVVVENGLLGRPHFGLVRLGPDGPQRFVDQVGDGFCVDADGRFYVAGGRHGVTVLEPDGRTVEVLPLPGRGVTTNCCFGGADGRTLFATDAVPGGVWAWEGLPTPGLAVLAWPSPVA
jgi:gluconolactonase